MDAHEQLAAGQLAENEGDFVAAASVYRASLSATDERVVAEAHFLLGRVSWRQGRIDAALAEYESARTLADRLGDAELHACVDNGLGAIHYARGDYESARAAYASAASRTMDTSLRGKLLLNLGVIENAEGNIDAAWEHYDRAIHLFEECGDSQSAILALHNRGMVEAERTNWAEADATFVRALAMATTAGSRELIAKTLVNRSEVLVELDALSEAVEHCDEALSIYSAIGDEVGRGEALRWRAHALGRAGQHLLAERNASEALHIAMRAGARLLEAQAARDLGVLRGLLGDRAGGVKELRRALALFTELGAKREAADVGALLQHPTPNRSLQRLPPEPG